MSEPIYTEETLDRVRETYIEVGRLRQMNDLGRAGTPFIVPHELTNEVLRLLIRNGFEISNDNALYAFRVHRPPETGRA